MQPEAEDQSVRQLLETYARVMAELRARGVVRTANSPVGDYAEYLVASALDLDRTTNSSAGCDAIAPDGTKYEVKSRRITAESSANRFSAIRQLEANHFDFVVAVIFDHLFGVQRAVKIPRSAVERLCFWQKHVNGWILPVRDSVWSDSDVEDITPLVIAAQGWDGPG